MKRLDGKAFWTNVDKLLVQRKSSLKDLCRFCNINYTGAVGNRSAELFPPKLDTLISMAEYLHVSLDELVYGSKTEDPDYLAFKELQRKLSNASPEAIDIIKALIGGKIK